MKKNYLTSNPGQTKKIGEILATRVIAQAIAKGEEEALASSTKEVLKTKIKKTAFVIGLEGGLGGGKTTFLQGFAKGLGIKQRILSPTFVIMKNFKISKCRNFEFFYHIDCYRISKPKEILDLGFKKIISNSKNIVAVEWADRIKKILPKNSLNLEFQFIDKNKRKISLSKI